jgi:hypothetical protein
MAQAIPSSFSGQVKVGMDGIPSFAENDIKKEAKNNLAKGS